MKSTLVIIATFVAAMMNTADASQVRSQAAISQFKQSNPCPANGSAKGPCPGYVIDHIEPLACGGLDQPSNMQWQTTEDSKAKDKWERADCGSLMAVRGRRSSGGSYSKRRYSTGRSRSSGSGSGGGVASTPSNGNYHIGPRGGCYTFSGSGKKQYVDHSYCS
ncbi:hypothetical protein JWZ98_11200 [Methylomonas sp. EFPC1]|uniref:hypothetical protein n=1 Tax=Methylomonas sp. EFPC1 TaxID=2812647 RepID=UPI001967773D|nr:hypothetical protein [Methylomonas sp. EFPC1]QSB03443.1 hypothetical protein JWZ98_11200 [Methylomonas sp. EFPC1]